MRGRLRNLSQRRDPLGIGLVDQQLTVKRDQIEDIEPNRKFRAGAFDLATPSEPPHQLLKRERVAFRIDGNYLAVEDDVAIAQRAHLFERPRANSGDFVEPPRKIRVTPSA